MNIIEKLWSLLPDKCEAAGCCRKGVRGNENIVEGMIMCDYCFSKYLDAQAELANGDTRVKSIKSRSS